MNRVLDITPKNFANPQFRAEAENEPIITFYCIDESGQHTLELPIHQKLFFADSVSRVPQVLDDVEEEERYDFRAILGAGARIDVSSQWEAFESFRTWLYTGIYENAEINGTHLDAYLLSTTLRSSRFGNAVMQKILAALPKSKFDENLKDTYRLIFRKCGPNSPLRALYFQCAVFWGLEFGGGGGGRPSSFYGAGVLGLDPDIDFELIAELQAFKNIFCACAVPPQPEPQPEPEQEVVPRPRARSLDDQAGIGGCTCQRAPWLRPEQFFVGV